MRPASLLEVSRLPSERGVATRGLQSGRRCLSAALGPWSIDARCRAARRCGGGRRAKLLGLSREVEGAAARSGVADPGRHSHRIS